MDEKTERLIKIIEEVKAESAENNFAFIVPHFMAKSFTSYCSMREDLILIKEYIACLEREDNRVINSALTYSTISLYGKCFTDATKSKAPKLEPSHLFKEKAELKETHDYLMNLRHHFIAHRGDTESEVEGAFLLIPKEEKDPQMRFLGLKRMTFSQEKKKKIIVLIDFLLDEVMKKIERAGQKMYSAYLKNFTPEEMGIMRIDNVEEE